LPIGDTHFLQARRVLAKEKVSALSEGKRKKGRKKNRMRDMQEILAPRSEVK